MNCENHKYIGSLQKGTMKLTYQQIIAASNGMVRYEQNELGLELHRFTRNQEGFFYKTHPAYCRESFFNGYFGRNCRTSAGMTLDFISDAEEFIVEFGRIEHPNKPNQPSDADEQLFDLFIDNQLVESYQTNGNITYKASGKKQRFTLFFPTYRFPIIRSVELKGTTIFLPQKKPVDILFFGDSITQGAQAVHPSNTYVMKVARNLDVGILNQGSSGFVYDKESIEKVCDPKMVITAYGINDYGRKDLKTIKIDTIAFLEKVRQIYGNSKIVSILPTWTRTVWDSQDENLGIEKRQILKSVYEKYSDFVVDGHDLIPHDEKYFGDQVHPNDDGFECYGNNLTKELKKFF